MKKLEAQIDRYTYRVIWSEEDNEHVGLCAEFPSLSFLAPTKTKALSGIERVVREAVKDMQANKEPIPKPIVLHKYSGNFSLRMPSQVHRSLAIEAAEDGISLNRLINAKLLYKLA